ncbi:MAG: hypothetical protein ABEK50_14775 [bacterium]
MQDQNWMKSLAEHYENVRKTFREKNEYKNLIVLFDIDGTILDHRKTIFHLLKEYDRRRNTALFKGLNPEDIYVSENHLNRLLERYDLTEERVNDVINFYDENRWSEDVILNSHKPYRGVMDVIRWFQLQPNTEVGLNTARPESLREQTLKSLNLLGEEYKVTFSSELLHMNTGGWDNVRESKIEGIRYFQEEDFRIVAFLDNEPANLSALAEAHFEQDFLLLHAETCFDSNPDLLPESSLSGQNYGITGLIQSQAEPNRIQFIWDNLDTEQSLDRFLDSSVRWGKFPVRRDPETDELILRVDDYNQSPRRRENPLTLNAALKELKEHDKSIQFELNIEDPNLPTLTQVMDRHDLPDKIGFRIGVDRLRSHTFNSFLYSYSDATVEVTIDFMQQLLLGHPEKAHLMVDMLRENRPVNTFSVQWQTYGKKRIVQKLKEWNAPINLSNIPGLREFLEVDRLHPDSVTLTPTFTEPGASNNRIRRNEQLPSQLYE